MKPNKLMLAGLIVTLGGLFIVIRREMEIPGKLDRHRKSASFCPRSSVLLEGMTA